jgi:hypothetical protein
MDIKEITSDFLPALFILIFIINYLVCVRKLKKTSKQSESYDGFGSYSAQDAMHIEERHVSDLETCDSISADSGSCDSGE